VIMQDFKDGGGHPGGILLREIAQNVQDEPVFGLLGGDHENRRLKYITDERPNPGHRHPFAARLQTSLDSSPDPRPERLSWPMVSRLYR
jgi:hypothetical protein